MIPKPVFRSVRERSTMLLIAGLILALTGLGCRFGGLLVDSSPREVAPQEFPEQESSPPDASPTLLPPPSTSTESLPSPTPVLPTSTQAAQVETPVSPSPTSPPQPPAPSPTPLAEQETCSDETCSEEGSFLLSRPVGGDGRKVIDVSNRFGEYSRRTKEAHHGVDFLNSTGTPVLAAAGGEVVVASDDSRTAYGSRTNTYGNLVILEHSLPGFSEPVFTLYAHLSQVSVKAGDTVNAGQQIGAVGSSGSVSGSTLHFEVRVGENVYGAVRNPELWLQPSAGETGEPLGALAGRILDAQGKPIPMGNITIERLGGPGQPALDQLYLKTYTDLRLAGLSPWEETFAAADLPPGPYQISFWLHGMQQRVIDILPGKLTVATFNLPSP